jgi:hypothetical protein
MPVIKENSTLVEVLAEKLPLSAKGAIKKDTAKQHIAAANAGFTPKKMPITAPAKAACDITSATNGMFKKNTHTPIIAQLRAHNADAINALIKNGLSPVKLDIISIATVIYR